MVVQVVVEVQMIVLVLDLIDETMMKTHVIVLEFVQCPLKVVNVVVMVRHVESRRRGRIVRFWTERSLKVVQVRPVDNHHEVS